MKHLFFAFFMFLSFAASAQGVDSNALKEQLSLQAKDWILISRIANNGVSERLYDSVKVRIRSQVSSVTSTSALKIDSVSVGTLIQISRWLRTQPYQVVAPVFTRINTAIKNISNTYLQNQIDAMDAEAQTNYTNLLKGELDRVKRNQ